MRSEKSVPIMHDPEEDEFLALLDSQRQKGSNDDFMDDLYSELDDVEDEEDEIEEEEYAVEGGIGLFGDEE